MAQIRHLAFAAEHPGKTAEFYKSAFGFRELARFELSDNREVAPNGRVFCSAIKT